MKWVKTQKMVKNGEKWPNILWKSCGVNTAWILNYVWPFHKIMHERVKQDKNNQILLLLVRQMSPITSTI